MDHDVHYRHARRDDIPALASLLQQDALGSERERAEVLEPYETAFDEIDSDPNNELIVVEHSGEIVGCLQLTFIRQLTYQGGRRAQIEGVRIAAAQRRRGLGARLIQWAVDRAKRRGCHLVQLTTDVRRPEALDFYLELGFVQTHHGLKLHLSEPRCESRA